MATFFTKETLLQNTNFTNSVKSVYKTDLADVANRYASLCEGLTEDVYLFSSPGRAELIGNHTDHNHGLVVACSIDLDVACAVNKREDNLIVIKSAGYEPFTVNVNELDVNVNEYGTTMALVRGVVKGFINKGYSVGGFTAHAHSTIFKGAGVSSSAAFELLICEILNTLYNEGKVDFVQKAIISRFAENVYFGKPSGLMDQLTISRGGVSYMDFFNEVPFSENAPYNLENLSLVIINCGGDHCNLTDEYSAIRYEMNEIAQYFDKDVLAKVKEEDFYASLPILKEKFTGRAILRAMHFFDENNRVKDCVKALKANDKNAFLNLITKSGISSYTLLQNCYPSADVIQSVPLALAIVSHKEDTLAYRVHGGGFAGTILTFVDTEKADNYVKFATEYFGKENVFCVNVRQKGATYLTKLEK